MNLEILVAAHKEYPMPKDPVYLPVQVNSALKGHFAGTWAYDDEGEHISSKNFSYCELTALYWGWKNLDCDYCGLVHYRRYFTGKKKALSMAPAGTEEAADKKWQKILSGDEAQALLSQLASRNVFVILPKKRYYVLETLYSHYAHSHHEEDLQAAVQVIHEDYPDYSDAFVEVMKRRSAHMFNMCIMRKDLLDEYCGWLFELLAKIEKILDISEYTDFDKRVFGRLSELFLDVWITRNQVPFYELPVENLEGENWPAKILLFLKRKFRRQNP